MPDCEIWGRRHACVTTVKDLRVLASQMGCAGSRMHTRIEPCLFMQPAMLPFYMKVLCLLQSPELMCQPDMPAVKVLLDEFLG